MCSRAVRGYPDDHCESVTDPEIVGIMNDLFVDDMVDMLEELPANVVKRVLKNATPEKRAMINQFLRIRRTQPAAL